MIHFGIEGHKQNNYEGIQSRLKATVLYSLKVMKLGLRTIVLFHSLKE